MQRPGFPQCRLPCGTAHYGCWRHCRLRLALPLAAKFPLQCRTLGEAAKAAAALNYPALSAELGAAHERGIREALRYAIADATGTDADLLERENPLLIDIADGGFREGA